MNWEPETSVAKDALTVDCPTFREELAKSAQRFESRLQGARVELDQTRSRMFSLERECEALQQACEALMGIIRRSEEIDTPVNKPKW